MVDGQAAGGDGLRGDVSLWACSKAHWKKNLKSCHWLQRLLDPVLPRRAGTIRPMIGQAFPMLLDASVPQAWPALSMPEQDVLSAHCQLWRWLFDAAGNWPGTSDSFQAGHQIAICHPALVRRRGRQEQSHMPQSGKALESYEWPPRRAAYVFGALWAFCEVPPRSADEHLKGNCG